jgi:hypothetical protein
MANVDSFSSRQLQSGSQLMLFGTNVRVEQDPDMVKYSYVAVSCSLTRQSVPILVEFIHGRRSAYQALGIGATGMALAVASASVVYSAASGLGRQKSPFGSL